MKNLIQYLTESHCASEIADRLEKQLPFCAIGDEAIDVVMGTVNAYAKKICFDLAETHFEDGKIEKTIVSTLNKDKSHDYVVVFTNVDKATDDDLNALLPITLYKHVDSEKLDNIITVALCATNTNNISKCKPLFDRVKPVIKC